jgi:hypothetical protein
MLSKLMEKQSKCEEGREEARKEERSSSEKVKQ